jgi:peptide/nickel transport system permease protein
MWRYTLRRLAFLPLIIISVSIITFVLLRVLPQQDPAILMAGQNATPEQVEAIHKELGLDRPIMVQFFDWVGDVARGDLGQTYYGERDIMDEVIRRFPASAELIFLSLIISFAIGVTFGIISAVMRNSPLDYSVRLFAVFGQSIPEFFLLVLLIIIPSILWNYAPPTGGYVSVRTARAKGLAGQTVVMNHAFRNTLAPLVTIMGTSFTLIFAGSVIAERIMGIDGLGQFFIQSVLQYDFPVVQFLVLYTATVIVLANLVVDLSYAIIDPRVKYR